ncbi:MAG: tRNA (adenosine(37)-N6)-threonylcarbamoyltransferase complex dimerization subunit type 1 TsaB [Candidatus Korobacteraceae bacterium]|jgi:tRNA threonylcarbamoyladenosine biosynthesis protein TsaB
MLIVAIDTSGRRGSVALCRGDAASFEGVQLTPLEGGTYSARLMPTISSLLEQNGFDRKDVGGFVVVSGPGSFTGLRVGLATVKGLCEILRKPLATVSMLEAVAVTYGAGGETVVTAVLDAGRGEVYVGEYRFGSGSASLQREYIVKMAEFATEASRIGGELLTPDAAVAEFLRTAGVGVRQVAPVQADGIGRIGLRKLLTGDVADAASVDVNYIRRSDAEIFSAPKG